MADLPLAFGSQEDKPGFGVHAALCSAGRHDCYPWFDFKGFLVNDHLPFPFKEVIRGRLAGVDRDLPAGFKADDKRFELRCLDQELRLGPVCREYRFGSYIWKVIIGHMLLLAIHAMSLHRFLAFQFALAQRRGLWDLLQCPLEYSDIYRNALKENELLFELKFV
jgi:hypothetical protein